MNIDKISQGNNEKFDLIRMILFIVVFLLLIVFMTSCVTSKKVEKEFVYKTDSVWVHDTLKIVKTKTEVRTDIQRDTLWRDYIIGSLDTVWKIRVDTVYVYRTKYIYEKSEREETDSTTQAKENIQKGGTSEVREVEKVIEKPVPIYKKALVVLGLIVVAAIFFIVGRYGDIFKKDTNR